MWGASALAGTSTTTSPTPSWPGLSTVVVVATSGGLMVFAATWEMRVRTPSNVVPVTSPA